MEDLKHFCQNWGDQVCHPDVSKWRYANKLEEAEAIPVRPAPPVLDAICKKCESTYFVVDQMICPKCDSIKIEKSGGAHRIQGMAWLYGFSCQNCHAYFWMPEKIL